MKNKFKIFLCVIMIFVFSFGTCSVAFASTGEPKDIDKAWSIVKSYWLDNSQSVVDTYYLNDDFFPVLLYSYGGKSYLLVDTGNNSEYSFNANREFGILHNAKLYSFDNVNMYSKPTGVATRYHGGPNYFSVNYLNFDNFTSGSTVILGSKFDILNPSGEVVFQQGTSQSPNPNPETPPSTPGSNTLSSLLNKNLPMLKEVLSEIIALLPVLLPVLITLLAIRKGLKFTLQTLRSS